MTIGDLIYRKSANWARWLLNSQIKITSPSDGGVLEDDPKRLGGVTTYRVEGDLQYLPKDHQIWLLRQNEITSKIWPQGFFRVIFDPTSRRWQGRVNGERPSPFRLIAVVAPPTSHDYFTY